MSSARREHKRRRFYWRSDVEKALEVLARYKSDVSLRKAGARKNLEDFIEQRKGVVKAMREVRPSSIQAFLITEFPSTSTNAMNGCV